MTAGGVSLALVMPSRNRADLAITACEALLTQTGADFHLFVSDNSTETGEVRRLVAYCERADPQRLTYLRPPKPLPQPTHWDWALGAAIERSKATHFTIHYDRRVTKPGDLRHLCEGLARFPEDVITWTVDQIFRDSRRSTVWQTPWTGEFYAIRTARVAEMTSKGLIAEMGQAYPLLSNCGVPRQVLVTIRQRFGDFCDSGGPDSCFTYRFCATHQRYIHFDRPLGIVYASNRSTGLGYLKGAGGDFDDFVQSWREKPWMDAAPIPGLNLGANLMFHEYELVRRATNHPAFPPIDRSGYLRDLARGLQWVQDPRRAAELRSVLTKHGWRPDSEGSVLRGTDVPAQPAVRARTPAAVRAVLRKGARFLIQRLVLVRARIKNEAPEHISGFSFRTDRAALRHAVAYPRQPSVSNPYLEPLQPVAVSSPPAVEGGRKLRCEGIATH